MRQHSVTLFHILAAVLECRTGGLAAGVTLDATLGFLMRQLEVEVPVRGAVVAVVAVEAVFKATTIAVVTKVDVVVAVVVTVVVMTVVVDTRRCRGTVASYLAATLGH